MHRRFAARSDLPVGRARLTTTNERSSADPCAIGALRVHVHWLRCGLCKAVMNHRSPKFLLALLLVARFVRG